MTDPTPLITEGGIAASHAEVEDFRPLVGPSTGGEFNTIKAALVPVACFRVDNIRFKFDSSFIQPGIEAELKHLAELLKKHPPTSIAKTATPPESVGCPLSIFGHADPVGDDEYNKQLSGRRAAAVYGLLTRDVELWDELFKNPIGNDKWGKESIQTMVIETTVPKPTEEPDVSTIENNPSQRKALYQSYMDKLCEQFDKEGKPKPDKAGKPEILKLEKTDFLAQGQDKNGKGDYQGCGEFNPILLFSQEEEKAFQQDKNKTKRNQANEPNRRVMVLIFRKGTKVDPNRWPCPRVKEGTAGCKKRFWSDGEKRRTTKQSDKQRKFEETKDTFACRFYDRLMSESPCEMILKTFKIRLYDPFGNAISGAPFEVKVGLREPVRGIASKKKGEEGIAVVQDIEFPNRCAIKWGFSSSKEGEIAELIFSLDMFLTQDNLSKEEEAKQKLHNLGYSKENDQVANVAAFQRDYGHLAKPPLTVFKGSLDDEDERTIELIRKVYKQCAINLRNSATLKEG